MMKNLAAQWQGELDRDESTSQKKTDLQDCIDMIDNSVEVTRISSRGIWLKTHDRKFFLSHYDFPWFKHKPVQAVLHVEEAAPGKFYWPQINVQLAQEAIEALNRPIPGRAAR